MYGYYLYMRFFFERTSCTWSDILCFSAFIVNTAVLLATTDNRVRIPVWLGVHSGLLLFAFLPVGGAFFAKPEILYYLACCFPALLVLARISMLPVAAPIKDRRVKTKAVVNHSVVLRNLFFLYLAVITVVLIVCRTETEPFRFDGVLGCYLIFSLFFVFCFLRFTQQEPKNKKAFVSVSLQFFVWNAHNCLSYIFLFSNYETNLVQFLFPLFFSVLFFFYRFPEAKNAVFGADT